MGFIEVNQLFKNYGDYQALKGVEFTVNEGEIFGFLGPNGAGKTTTINILTGLSKPSSGTFHYGNLDGLKQIKKIQNIIGIVSDESNLYNELNGFENLCFCGALYGMKKKERETRAHELLEKFGLTDTGKKTFNKYSKGMKRKLTIAAGIIHKPAVLFLDEPTTGIDVESAREIRNIILNLNREGTTVFLTTHYIEEAERLCKRIAFIVEGKIIRISTLDELLNEIMTKHSLRFTFEPNDKDIYSIISSSFPNQEIILSNNNVITVQSDKKINLKPYMNVFYDNNINVWEAKIVRPSLEEAFINVTGIGIEKMKKDKEGLIK